MTSKRLGRLVRLKKLVEASRAAELAEEQQSLTSEQARLEQLRSEAAATERALVRADVTAEELAMASAWQDRLGERAAIQEVAVSQAEERVAERAQGVQLAWRERRLLEGVHGRAKDRESAADADKERKANDAIALRSYGRRGE